jgi:hypothetical protein
MVIYVITGWRMEYTKSVCNISEQKIYCIRFCDVLIIKG